MKTNQDKKCIYSEDCGFYRIGKCDRAESYNGLFRQCYHLWRKRKASIKYEKYPYLRYVGIDTD